MEGFVAATKQVVKINVLEEVNFLPSGYPFIHATKCTLNREAMQSFPKELNSPGKVSKVSKLG